MNQSPVLGVDIGGSHITAALVDVETGQPIEASETRLEVNSDGTAQELLDAWCSAISRTTENCDIKSMPIGVAMPGPFDYENGICLIREQKKFKALYKVNIKELIAQRLGTNPAFIHFMNDACAFLEGEMLGGALRGHKNVMGITLGTGLGSAYNTTGECIDADLWHTPYLDKTAEDFLATRWFVGRYNQLTGDNITGVKQLAGLAQSQPAVKVIFHEFAENLAGLMDEQQKLHGYTRIVVGGNIARASDLFSNDCDAFLTRNKSSVQYCLAELGERAPLIGAAGMAARRSGLNQDHLAQAAPAR